MRKQIENKAGTVFGRAGARALLAASLATALATGPAWVAAQAFPAKPIRIIVSTSPGGLTDLISRNSGQSVSEAVGQPVVIEYRPGAGTFIGISACAKSPPDGYTVCVTTPESDRKSTRLNSSH